MDWTDVHYRQLARLISKHTWLWTEMVVDKTILNVPLIDKHLWFPPEQRPIVLQLGGSWDALQPYQLSAGSLGSTTLFCMPACHHPLLADQYSR